MLHFLVAIQLWLGLGAAKATMATSCAVGKITVNGVLLFREGVQDEVPPLSAQ